MLADVMLAETLRSARETADSIELDAMAAAALATFCGVAAIMLAE
jgi:hypothetical protein